MKRNLTPTVQAWVSIAYNISQILFNSNDPGLFKSSIMFLAGAALSILGRSWADLAALVVSLIGFIIFGFLVINESFNFDLSYIMVVFVNCPLFLYLLFKSYENFKSLASRNP